MSSLLRHDGEAEINHQYSPGLTEKEAFLCGLPGAPLGAGRVTRMATLGCNHCGGVQIVNPWRTRERGYCKMCNHYICDGCKCSTLLPGYVHRTIQDLTELIQSGNWTLSGPTTRPILVPVKKEI